ncbi:MAG: hypothetical protein QXF01_00015 [Candidatus Micrarchaeaceae archaeon]
MRRTSMFIVSFILAIIFIISYSYLGLGVTPPAASTTTAEQPAAYATAIANAIVVGFSPSINISVKCTNAEQTKQVYLAISNSIALLEANNSVSDFIPIGSNISVSSGNANSLQIYNYEYSSLNASAKSCVTFAGGEVVRLPPEITFDVQGQEIPVFIQNASIENMLPLNFSQNLSYTIPVKVSALLTQNYTVYGNMAVTRI